uniref:Uncharacterized protein n=1 Tax=Arundo donax TaxID=35708 RepID=A0A0A9HCZ2_ARUDO
MRGAGDVAPLAEARRRAHRRVRVLVQRHAPYGTQHGVGVVVQAAVAGAAGVGNRQRHGNRQLQRRRHRHGCRVAEPVAAAAACRREEPGVEGGVVVVMVIGCCGGGEADLEGEIRLGREEFH